MTTETFYLATALFLLITLLGGLIRILIGPTRGDRMLAAQLFGTTGVAIILLLFEALERPALRDVALVVVLPTEGEARHWGLIVIAIAAATLVSLLLAPSSGLGLSPTGWVKFVSFFLTQSVLGGVDVALRLLSRRPRLDPVYVECRLRLREEPARVLVANTMSLMPGTLSVSLEGQGVKMHVLDRAMPAIERAREVEEHAARMFRLELDD